MYIIFSCGIGRIYVFSKNPHLKCNNKISIFNTFIKILICELHARARVEITYSYYSYYNDNINRNDVSLWKWSSQNVNLHEINISQTNLCDKFKVSLGALCVCLKIVQNYHITEYRTKSSCNHHHSSKQISYNLIISFVKSHLIGMSDKMF